ncbi:ATP-grasp domain-containing protein [Deinococcus cellulosilyticus]|uniref:ATP-grasp domain-containing protein n=1 Tax=Deinococcus cellulosilyticus (strain DSM 18568 / NBRC 106333 / KACC 11606 / 5516J-15) TaxID=1223518 RepID=A0A511MWS0_DEIC1|nr:ATP-grasp domain-containing protein [Deinococcus cellulosilyticus]GEM44617.1 hypothetical protein DC3_02520 [Deinococcus cellulosilyticus NBRC 106333 = KACC 11606]
MSLRILYPCQPFDLKTTDEQYLEEAQLAVALGFQTGRLSFEDLLDGKLKVSPPLQEGETVLYRGWMMEAKTYLLFETLLKQQGVQILTPHAAYQRTHHLPEWYALLQEHTPETLFFANGEEAVKGLAHVSWPGFFVKDWVKSLSTGHGPVAQTPEEILTIQSQMIQYRGSIEGGLCIRKLESFLPETEERCFVVQGIPYGRTPFVPEVVQLAAQTVYSPFFSVDVVQRDDGTLRIVELGDGQVSDLKHWSLEEFRTVLQALPMPG